MLKKSLFSIAVFFGFTGQVLAVLPDCVGSQLSMTGDNEEQCISTCSAIAEFEDAQLDPGEEGFCVGDATESRFTLYAVKLGISEQAEATCDLWQGNVVIDKTSYLQGEAIEAGGSFGYCEPGTYDVVFLTTSRIEYIAGQTVFPDGSGKVVKTTSTFAADVADYENSAGWLETGTNHSNDNLPYVRLSNSWNNIYKKLASGPSSDDLSGANAALMEFDWAKLSVIGNTKQTSGLLQDWYCEGSTTDLCERVIAGRNELRATMNVDVINFPSGGLVVTETIQPNWNISYFSLNRDVERGLRFLWTTDGSGNLRYHGVNAGEAGLEVTISPIDIASTP